MKGHKPTPQEMELGRLLNNEKALTEKWYQRMSGEMKWLPGEKQEFGKMFSSLEERIHQLQGNG